MLIGTFCSYFQPLQKTASRSPTISPGTAQHVCLRPWQSPHEIHAHAPSRVEDYVFSHLPLHSQQLPRSPCPMIPIGGIQMVQTRPSSHATLGRGSVMSLHAGHFAPGGTLSEFGPVKERNPAARGPQEMASSSATPPLQSSSYLEGTIRTSKLQRKVAEEEYRVKTCVELSGREQKGCSSPSESSSPKGEHSPGSLMSGEEPLVKTGKENPRYSSTSFEPTRTFISDFPAQTLDRSSSTGCLAESPSGQSTSCQLSIRRRNFSGELNPQVGAHRRNSPPLEQAGFSLPQREGDDDTGST